MLCVVTGTLVCATERAFVLGDTKLPPPARLRAPTALASSYLPAPASLRERCVVSERGQIVDLFRSLDWQIVTEKNIRLYRQITSSCKKD